MFKEILAYFGQYWYLVAAFAALLIVTVFVWMKAAASSRRSGADRESILKQLKEEHDLAIEFASLTAEKARAEEPKRLLRGLAAVIQKELEPQSDMNAAFHSLPVPKQYVYALYYVLCEGAESLGAFFRQNGKPLTTAANAAARDVIGGEFASVFARGYQMFDGEDEEISVTEPGVSDLNEAFRAVMERESGAAFESVKIYVNQHLEVFVSL
ncbi:MAG: hypothetical protein FWF05_01950 [Oscillospiraceae bacterium]|nr:hypothetical protein [Oscillospiraceae bacterium]